MPQKKEKGEDKNSMESKLIFREMQPTDEDLKLFYNSFIENGSPKSMELIRWQYKKIICKFCNNK